ncbi:hypothetical protein HGRIS_005956 [Hohenbuehelia grisea]|uniref:Serine-rich protein n=1 Tax=Hohenbuehelia grisea TaxID=104357 RepID=A0ABR3K0X5_9AGAR
MSGFLSRLRRHGHSFPERTESPKTPPDRPRTSWSEPAVQWPTKIHPDLNALVADSASRPLPSSLAPGTGGLRPSPSFLRRQRERRHSDVGRIRETWSSSPRHSTPERRSPHQPSEETPSPERDYDTAPSSQESSDMSPISPEIVRPIPDVSVSSQSNSPVPDASALGVSPRLTSRFSHTSGSSFGYSPPATGHSIFGRQLAFRLGLSAFGGRRNTEEDSESNRHSRRRWGHESPLLYDSRSPSLRPASRGRSIGRSRSPSFRSGSMRPRIPRSAFSSPSPLPSSADEMNYSPSSRRMTLDLYHAFTTQDHDSNYAAEYNSQRHSVHDADDELILQSLSRRSTSLRSSSPVSIVISLNSGTQSESSISPHRTSYRDQRRSNTYDYSNSFERTLARASQIAPMDVEDTPNSPPFSIEQPSPHPPRPSSHIARLREEYLAEARARRELEAANMAHSAESVKRSRFRSWSFGRRPSEHVSSPKSISSPQLTTFTPNLDNMDTDKDLPPLPSSEETSPSSSRFGTFSSMASKATFRSQKSKNKEKGRQGGSVNARRTSADWSARQAAEGQSWEAEVARELITQMSFGEGYSRDFAASRDFGQHVGRASGEASYLSYTQSVETFQHPHYRDRSTQSLTIPTVSTFGRKDKGKAKEAFDFGMAPSASGNTVTFTDHDREVIPSSQSHTRSLSSRKAASTRSGNGSSASGSVGRTKTPSPPKSAMRQSQQRPPVDTSSTFLQLPALEFTAPTPRESPGDRSPSETAHSSHLPSALKPRASGSNLPPQITRSGSKGKRKAEDVEGGGTPPKEGHRATFAVEPRSHRASATSGSSHAPSSYHRKRARLSTSETLSRSASHDREVTTSTGTWSSRSSAQIAAVAAAAAARTSKPPSRAPSRASAFAASIGRSTGGSHYHQASSRRSISQMSATSIPISALVSPHAPSLSTRSQTYHMRDPRRPTKPFETPWSLRFASPSEPGSGSPAHAWMFFIGFILFPLWWFAAFWRIPRTRHVGGNEVEKAVTLDDPQVEFDAKSWRFRCRVMAFVSLFTYVPFIVLLAVFVRR